MVTGTGKAETRELTILNLTQDITDTLWDLQNRLDSRFCRLPKDEGKAEQGRPQNPNILDEIIEGLGESKAHLLRITSFISSEVLPKIN